MSEERALYKTTESGPPTRLACEDCMYEYEAGATDSRCPYCRLLDACQAIVNQANWHAILHHGQSAIIDPDLALEMANALLEIKRSAKKSA